METQQNFESLAQGSIVLNHEAQNHLRTAGKWASFLGIVGFISCVLIWLAAGTFNYVLNKLQDVIPNYQVMGMVAISGIFTTIFILTGILYLFFALYLFQFGSKIKKGLVFKDNAQIAGGIGKLKSFFKLWGILTITTIVLYILIIAGYIFAVVHAS